MIKNSLLNPDSAKQNFAFQFLYQAAILVIPLIVSPYLTRTLGSNSLGVYTYTYSIAYYFVIVAMLGINRHGQRIIAQKREDLTALRKTFWSLLCVHLIASVLSLMAYFIYVIWICGSDQDIAIIQGIYVFSAALDITWVLQGLEKFRIIAVLNLIVKLLETVCIFTFVRSPADTAIYTLIMCASVCLGYLVMVPQILSAIPPIRFSVKDMAEHIKPLFTLFAASVAVTLYTVFDKTLLGLLSTKNNVAFYEYSDKIVKVPRHFIGVIGTVLFPRACVYAANKDFKGMRKTYDSCLIVTCFIGFASCFGLAAVADLFATIYYGEAFAICGPVIISMCPLILIIGLGETVRDSFIYPLKKDATMVRILTANAVVNLILSYLLIPVLGIYGAVVGTIAAETVGLVAEFIVCRKYISIPDTLKNGLPFAGIGLIMYVVVRITAHYTTASVIGLLLQIGVGAFVYLLLAFLYGYFFNDLMQRTFLEVIGWIKDRMGINHKS